MGLKEVGALGIGSLALDFGLGNVKGSGKVEVNRQLTICTYKLCIIVIVISL